LLDAIAAAQCDIDKADPLKRMELYKRKDELLDQLQLTTKKPKHLCMKLAHKWYIEKAQALHGNQAVQTNLKF
jgi:hypothetical protein